MPVPNREERRMIPTKMRRQLRAWQQAHNEHERLAREKRDREIKEAKAENRRIEREWKANGGKLPSPKVLKSKCEGKKIIDYVLVE